MPAKTFTKLLIITVICLLIIFTSVKASESSSEENIGEGAEPTSSLIRRPDENRPDDQYTVDLFGRPLTIGGEISSDFDFISDLALDQQDDDLRRIDIKLETEFFYQYSDDLLMFFETIFSNRRDEEPESNQQTKTSQIQRGEMWLYSKGLLNDQLDLQIGRQNFVEKRQWWWDKNLDAVRLHFKTENTRFELALAEELFPISTKDDEIDPDEEDILRIISSASINTLSRHRQEFFFIYQNDRSNTEQVAQIIRRDARDESDAELVWLGARAIGRWKLDGGGRLRYWFDAGWVSGNERLIDYDSLSAIESEVDSITRMKIDGWGLDAGITWETRWQTPWNFTLSFARGSGDDNFADNKDTSFRQTGLNNNNAKFRGVNRLRYYGELLRPDLSNLEIFTLGFGVRFWNKSSLDVVFHSYQQVNSSKSLVGDDLDIDPSGLNQAIGEEIDIVLGIEEWQQFEFELVASAFRAGNAFAEQSGDIALKIELNFSFNF